MLPKRLTPTTALPSEHDGLEYVLRSQLSDIGSDDCLWDTDAKHTLYIQAIIAAVTLGWLCKTIMAWRGSLGDPFSDLFSSPVHISVMSTKFSQS